MKTTIIASITILATAVFLHAQQPAPPSLLLPKAAGIAQTTLDGLKLPPEYFLRSISYQPSSEKDPTPFYLATFEPPKVTRIEPGTTPEPLKIKYIKVLLDGTASVIEQEQPRRIIRPAKK